MIRPIVLSSGHAAPQDFDPPVPGRLRRRTLDGLDSRVARPTYDISAVGRGVVHLGLGAFHRSHQAVYLDRLARQGARGWGVVGIGLRHSNHRRELLSQDGLYTVLELGGQEPRARVIGVLRDYLSAPQQPASAAAALQDPRTRLVTLTLTAPSYGDEAHTTAFELIAEALAARRRRGGQPFTVLSCDNLPNNGEAARRRVLEAAERRDPALARWIETHAAFPNCMADRITPPASERDRLLLQRRFGIDDRALVVTEPFTQWVVEDSFSSVRPPLEDVGVQLVADVAPYVEMKMRMLNAAHVALGYLGADTPHASTDTAMNDPVLGPLVERLLAEEVGPLLRPVPGLDPRSYCRDVLERLRNPAMADPLSRLRRRGSVRIRNYVLPSVEAALAAGRPHRVLVSIVAAWIEHLRGAAEQVVAGTTTLSDLLEELQDPAAGRLLRPALAAHDDVRPLLAAAGYDSLRQSSEFVRALQSTLAVAKGAARAAS